MKTNDIIRRKSKDGQPVGPYLQVTQIEGNFAYASPIGLNEPNILIMKDNAYICSTAALPISEYVLNRLLSGEQTAIEHLVNKPWLKVYDDQPELIRVYTLPRCNEAIFEVERVLRIKRIHFNFGQSNVYIKVVLSNRIK